MLKLTVAFYENCDVPLKQMQSISESTVESFDWRGIGMEARHWPEAL